MSDPILFSVSSYCSRAQKKNLNSTLPVRQVTPKFACLGKQFIHSFFYLFQGTYLDKANNKCVVCSYCHKGEVVGEECVIWADTVCRKEQIQISPSQKPDPPMGITPTKSTPKLPSSASPKTTECRPQKGNIV